MVVGEVVAVPIDGIFGPGNFSGYPLWGITAIVIVLIDRFVIRKIPALRRAFGTRVPSSAGA